jgi:adhesin transport system outer membrane protein
MKSKNTFRISSIASAIIMVSAYMLTTNASAEELITMQKAVETAVLKNPEVLQSYKNFEAAVKDKDAAWGKYLPSVDLTSSYGSESRKDPLPIPSLGRNYTRDQTSLSLKQMIFDGFATKNEVARLDRTSKARVYELENVSQSIAQDASRAYIDLIRYRALTTLAEDNYVAHKIIFEQLVLKAKAGVGKKSDVEQAQSRLALADYNMSVEGSNLHDIEARYQRLVGNLPPKDINSSTPVQKDIPADSKSAIGYAQLHNPALLATIEDTLSQQALVNYRTAAFVPRLDFRARADRGNDLNGYGGQHRNDVAELVMSWNLFNGMSDMNAKSKEMALLEAATNRRDTSCRNIRLELEIAYNDIKKLTEQVAFLDNRAVSIEKARDAYRKQFEIGQRTLIDLLNAENELFEAKRLYTNVVNDLSVAYVRTHYQMGTLLTTLGLTRYASVQAPLPVESSLVGGEIAACPAEAPNQYMPDRQYLDARAEEVLTAPAGKK